jgi:dynein heavy chain
MYLEPVFSSEDIIAQMPAEGTAFRAVNVAWHDLMERVHANPSAAVVQKYDDLEPILRAANLKLEKVQKGLNNYLEDKRGRFPRFFFLSNDELLEILSETKEPLRV